MKRKERMSNSQRRETKTENSFIKPSKFTQNKIERAMSSENRRNENFHENFRTPIRKMNFMPPDSQYGAR